MTPMLSPTSASFICNYGTLITGARSAWFYDPYMHIRTYDELKKIGKKILKIMISRGLVLFNDFDKIYDFYCPKPNNDFIFKKGMKVWTKNRIPFNDGTYLAKNAYVTILNLNHRRTNKTQISARGYEKCTKCIQITCSTSNDNLQAYAPL